MWQTLRDALRIKDIHGRRSVPALPQGWQLRREPVDREIKGCKSRIIRQLRMDRVIRHALSPVKIHQLSVFVYMQHIADVSAGKSKYPVSVNNRHNNASFSP